MTALQWHQPGDQIYESGLDRGVLYVNGQTGVAWNGLISVEEDIDHSTSPVYFDGLKFNDLVTLGDFNGSLKAFTYPDEFLECEGVLEDEVGVFVTAQPLKRFGLCYRTKISDGAYDTESGYKLHLLYNLTAIPSQRVRQTLTLEPEPMDFEWKLTGIPEDIDGYRPTCHLVIDSRNMDPWLLADIEDVLYGDSINDPRLPSLKGMIAFIRKWERLIIVDHGDGTWSAIAKDPAVINMLSATEFEITADNVVWNDPPTNSEYQISSSDKNEEDI